MKNVSDLCKRVLRQGHGIDTVKKLLEPVTSASAAARMAGNIARTSIRLDDETSHNGLENGAFWMSIRKQLESTNESLSRSPTIMD